MTFNKCLLTVAKLAHIYYIVRVLKKGGLMARPKKTKEAKRDKIVALYCTEKEKKAIQASALRAERADSVYLLEMFNQKENKNARAKAATEKIEDISNGVSKKTITRDTGVVIYNYLIESGEVELARAYKANLDIGLL
ncbi:MAG: hypothetical protein GY799_12315 [Desulfobulbaceae bacterium]|nr:hypothetical protein [Desulfobulbaceae bacterium]